MEIIFKKVHTTKDFIISGLTLAAGIGLFFASKGIGVAIMICGLIMLIVYKTGYKIDGIAALLKKSELELCGRNKNHILDFFNGKQHDLEIVCGHDGGTLLLEIWHNKGLQVAYARLSEYKEHTFQPITETIELQKKTTQTLISKL